MLQDIWRFINFTIGEQISEISNGFIALAGYKKQGYGTTTLALRLNPSGDTVCSRIFDIPEQNGPSALFTPIIAVVLNTQPDDGGYLDLCLLKTDSMFNVLWSKVYDFNDMLLKKIIPANDGGFIACGDSIIHCNDTWDIILMKFDQEGDTIWTREYVTGKQK